MAAAAGAVARAIPNGPAASAPHAASALSRLSVTRGTARFESARAKTPERRSRKRDSSRKGRSTGPDAAKIDWRIGEFREFPRALVLPTYNDDRGCRECNRQVLRGAGGGGGAQRWMIDSHAQDEKWTTLFLRMMKKKIVQDGTGVSFLFVLPARLCLYVVAIPSVRTSEGGLGDIANALVPQSGEERPSTHTTRHEDTRRPGRRRRGACGGGERRPGADHRCAGGGVADIPQKRAAVDSGFGSAGAHGSSGQGF